MGGDRCIVDRVVPPTAKSSVYRGGFVLGNAVAIEHTDDHINEGFAQEVRDASPSRPARKKRRGILLDRRLSVAARFQGR